MKNENIKVNKKHHPGLGCQVLIKTCLTESHNTNIQNNKMRDGEIYRQKYRPEETTLR